MANLPPTLHNPLPQHAAQYGGCPLVHGVLIDDIRGFVRLSMILSVDSHRTDYYPLDTGHLGLVCAREGHSCGKRKPAMPLETGALGGRSIIDGGCCASPRHSLLLASRTPHCAPPSTMRLPVRSHTQPYNIELVLGSGPDEQNPVLMIFQQVPPFSQTWKCDHPRTLHEGYREPLAATVQT